MLLAPPLAEAAPDWLRNFPQTREGFEALGEHSILCLRQDIEGAIATPGPAETPFPETHLEHLIIHLECLVEQLGAREARDEVQAREAHPNLPDLRGFLAIAYRRMSGESEVPPVPSAPHSSSEWSEGKADFVQNLPMTVAAAREDLGAAALDALDAKLAELETTTHVGDPDTMHNLTMIRFRLCFLERSIEKDAIDDEDLKARVATWKRRLYGILARQFDEPLPPSIPSARPASETVPGPATPPRQAEDEPVFPPEESPQAETPFPAASIEPSLSPRTLLETLSAQRGRVAAVIAALFLAAAASASYVAVTKGLDQTFGERVEQMERNFSRWMDRQLGEDPSNKKTKKSEKKTQ